MLRARLHRRVTHHVVNLGPHLIQLVGFLRWARWDVHVDRYDTTGAVASEEICAIALSGETLAEAERLAEDIYQVRTARGIVREHDVDGSPSIVILKPKTDTEFLAAIRGPLALLSRAEALDFIRAEVEAQAFRFIDEAPDA